MILPFLPLVARLPSTTGLRPGAAVDWPTSLEVADYLTASVDDRIQSPGPKALLFL